MQAMGVIRGVRHGGAFRHTCCCPGDRLPACAADRVRRAGAGQPGRHDLLGPADRARPGVPDRLVPHRDTSRGGHYAAPGGRVQRGPAPGPGQAHRDSGGQLPGRGRGRRGHRGPAGHSRLRRALPVQLRVLRHAGAPRLVRPGCAAGRPAALDPAAGQLHRAALRHRHRRLRPGPVRPPVGAAQDRRPGACRGDRRLDRRRVHQDPVSAAPGWLPATAGSADEPGPAGRPPRVVQLRLRPGHLVSGRRPDQPARLPDRAGCAEQHGLGPCAQPRAVLVPGRAGESEPGRHRIQPQPGRDLLGRQLDVRRLPPGVRERPEDRPAAPVRRPPEQRAWFLAVGYHQQRG